MRFKCRHFDYSSYGFWVLKKMFFSRPWLKAGSRTEPEPEPERESVRTGGISIEPEPELNKYFLKINRELNRIVDCEPVRTGFVLFHECCPTVRVLLPSKCKQVYTCAFIRYIGGGATKNFWKGRLMYRNSFILYI